MNKRTCLLIFKATQQTFKSLPDNNPSFNNTPTSKGEVSTSTCRLDMKYLIGIDGDKHQCSIHWHIYKIFFDISPPNVCHCSTETKCLLGIRPLKYFYFKTFIF